MGKVWKVKKKEEEEKQTPPETCLCTLIPGQGSKAARRRPIAKHQPNKGSGVCLKSLTFYPPFYLLKVE